MPPILHPETATRDVLAQALAESEVCVGVLGHILADTRRALARAVERQPELAGPLSAAFHSAGLHWRADGAIVSRFDGRETVHAVVPIGVRS